MYFRHLRSSILQNLQNAPKSSSRCISRLSWIIIVLILALMFAIIIQYQSNFFSTFVQKVNSGSHDNFIVGLWNWNSNFNETEFTRNENSSIGKNFNKIMSSANVNQVSQMRLLEATLHNKTWRDLLTGRIWPRTKVPETDNRIEKQVDFIEEYRKIKEAAGGVLKPKIILGVGEFNMRYFVEGEDIFTRTGCPRYWCNATRDGNLSHSADAVIFSEYNAKSILNPANKKPGQIWIAQHLESPKHNRIDTRLLKGLVNWTATYRSESTVTYNYGSFTNNTRHAAYPINITEDQKIHERREKFIKSSDNKLGLVAMLVSNCQGVKNKRLEYARTLNQYISVNIYGGCGDYKCPEKVSCLSWLAERYKFYLAFENSNCKDYITEKFIYNSLYFNMLPIVRGASKEDYERIAPPKSFIFAYDFNSPKDLANYLLLLHRNETLYLEYFKWKEEGWRRMWEGDDKYMCRLCTMLHLQSDVGYVHWYDDYEKWWNGVCYL